MCPRTACLRVLLCLWLLLPKLSCTTLLCHFCPPHRLEDPCNATETECQPEERCYTGIGSYGGLEQLSAQGCVFKELCGLERPLPFRGVNYTMRHACCSWGLCNGSPESADPWGPPCLLLYTMITLLCSRGVF
ncbi:SACA4 protein, partial [Atractosteus spatula]|nr:SACA4 protein [Atractosteus spatula]